MATQRSTLSTLVTLILAVACADPTTDPTSVAPSLHREGGEHRTVVVDPDGRHDATTIQAGIDMAPGGGHVLVRPGTYYEAIVIRKGLTLEGIGRWRDDDDDHHRRGHVGASGAVIVEQVQTARGGAPVILMLTSQAVVIRGLTLHHVGVRGITAQGAVDLTLEEMTWDGPDPLPLPIVSSGVTLENNAAQSGGRSRMVVRDSRIGTDGVGFRLFGDIDVVIERNVFAVTTSCVVVSPTTAGTQGASTNVDIVNNDFTQCGSNRAGFDGNGIRVEGTAGAATTGTVNLIGNTFRNTVRVAGDCNATGILYEFYSGRIEHNLFTNVVQDCATPAPNGRSFPAAIFVGSRIAGIRAASPTVRFNNIVGNSYAGLRIGPNQSTSLDARCNYWGSADGPSGSGPGTGDAVLVETGGATPIFTPFATGPVAQKRHHGDHDGKDDNDRHGRGKCHLDFSLWSDPVSLGTTINTAANEQGPSLSDDELSLYFGSDRTGGSGGFDIWVAERACRDCPWGTPVNLGSAINTASVDQGPNLSADGRLLFFNSNRAGGQGGTDLYVSQRTDVHDNFSWGPPVPIGVDVNTAASEGGLEYLPSVHGDVPRIFFNRTPAGATADIYVVPATSDGLANGPAALVAEISDPVAADQGTTVRVDGRELLFQSTRAGGLGGNDLWTSTRRNVDEPWSTPVNLGAPMNTAAAEQQASLSGDGRTLVFATSRAGSLGGTDIWMSTRTRIGR